MTKEGSDTRNVAADMAELCRIGQLLCAVLHAHIKVRAQKLFEFLLQLGVVFRAEFGGLHVLGSLN